MITSLLKIAFVVFFTMLVSSLEILLIPFHRSGKLFHSLAVFYARVVLSVCGVSVLVKGIENVEFTRSFIYIANHASLFDIPAVLAGIPDEIRLVYKKELESIPLFGWGLKYGKTYIGIDRRRGPSAVQSLEEAASRIRNGASVILFAEGTRTTDGSLQPFKRGPFNLAFRARVPVVPVTIKGSFEILPRNSWIIRPGTITLVFSPPIETPNSNGRKSELELQDRVYNEISKNFTQPAL